ncbi:hypothetical protein [Bradyrhizobium sp. 199]|uniref:hypothetical protein n=1 Tax=Bradyrhizobium sp. 199 TaxID=2782664 RepID=UPI001FF99D55|nr:hypothetical protein [Bradyrhizobium sp. 199]MCK1359964.1 hypothetical protein [Bradyrhizobium sp. 199]
MPTLSQAPALSPSHRYLFVVLVRLRRFVNRSVANMLVKRERAAVQFMTKKVGQRHPDCAGRSRGRVLGVRAALLGLIVAGLLSPAAARAEQPVSRDHRGGRAQQAPRVFCDARNHTHTPDGGCVTARGEATVRDHRSR